MGMPGITEDQRIMVVALLANAIRKDAHLRERAHELRRTGDPVAGAMAIRRAAPSQRYIDGMCDLIRVLFANGDLLVAQCLDDAYAQALGIPTPPGTTDTTPV
jgi:hypothetical protein